MDTIHLQINLFGALGELQPHIAFDVKPGIGSDAVRAMAVAALLQRHAAHPKLNHDALRGAALANDVEIFTQNTAIETAMTLALLPPVNGG